MALNYLFFFLFIMPEETTLGTSRCTVIYKDDPVTKIQIDAIRKMGANFIDTLEGFKNAITDNGAAMMSGEQARLFSEAYTLIETATMFGIKAVTK